MIIAGKRKKDKEKAKKVVNKVVKGSSYFDDGYQVGDVSKTILATGGNALSNIGKGFIGTTEGVADALTTTFGDLTQKSANAQATIWELFGNDDYAESLRQAGRQVKKASYENAKVDVTSTIFDSTEALNATKYLLGDKSAVNNKNVNWSEDLNKKSVAGELLQSAEQGIGNIGAFVGLGALTGGSTAGTFATSFVSSYGNTLTNDLRNGASEKEAKGHAISSGMAEAISEQFFQGIPGLNQAGWADTLVGNSVQKYFGSKAGKVALKIFDSAGEGFEEIISNMLEATFEGIRNGKSVGEIFSDASAQGFFKNEQTRDAFFSAIISSAITNGASNLISNQQKQSVLKAYAEENNISTKQAQELFDSLVEKKSNLEDTKNFKEQVETQEGIEQGLINELRQAQNEGQQVDLNELLSRTPTSRAEMQFAFDNEEAKNVKTDKQQVLANDMARLNNVKENHELYKTVNAIQSANDTQQYHITTTEGLYEMGLVNKTKDGQYVMEDGSPYVPRGLNYKDGDIYINADVGSQSGTQAVYHEMLEGFKKASPEQYNEFKQMVADIVGEKAIQKEFDTYKQMYGEDLTDDIRDEIINDKFGELAENENFINRISDNRTVLEKFIDSVKRMYKYVKGTPQERELMKLEKRLEKEFAKRYKETDFSKNKGSDKTAFSLEQNYRGSHQIENAKSITELNIDDVKNKVIEIDGYLTNQAQSDLKKLQKILNNPNETVKIYRAAPVNELNSGDWVTTDRSYAQNVANNNGGKVYTFEVKASDLYYPDNVRELPSLHRLSSFQYNGENANQTRYSLSTNKDSNGRTLTKEQQNFFKDSAIRVSSGEFGMPKITENGQLFEVYHGSNNDFTVFDKNYFGSANDMGWYGPGFYFAFTEGEARTYGSKVIKSYLNIKNPFFFSEEMQSYDGQDSGDVNFDYGSFMINMKNKFPDISSRETLRYTEYSNETGDLETKEISIKDVGNKIEEIYNSKDLKMITIDDNGTEKYQYVYQNDINDYNVSNDIKNLVENNHIYNKNDASFAVENSKYYNATTEDLQKLLDYFNKTNNDFSRTYIGYPIANKQVMENSRLTEATWYVTNDVYHNLERHMPEYYMQYLGNDIQQELIKKGYDGVVQSRSGDEIVAFYPNQIKNVDNLNPTDDSDIRYSLTSNENIDSKEIAPIGSTIQNELAPIREDLSNITEQMNNLSNQLETMQESLKNTSESATKGYVEPFREQRYENQSYTPLTEQDAELYQNALMNDEGYVNSLEAEANNINDTLINTITNNVQNQLGLSKNQKTTLENIVRESIENDYSTDEISQRLEQEFKNQEYKLTNEEAKNVKKLIKLNPIKVSDGIKKDIADYNDFQRKNLNKITFSRNGVPVDIAYKVLNEQAPGYFPSDIINPTDQLLKISDVANMANETIEKVEISSDVFDNMADYITNSILEERYNNQVDSQASLDKDIQFNMTEDIAPTTIRTQESIDDFINNRDIAPVRQDVQQQNNIREQLDKMRIKAQEMFINRNYVIDETAKATGNNEIKYLGDQWNNAQAEADFNIKQHQTDINGNWIGDSLDTIFKSIEDAGEALPFNDYLIQKSNIERHNVGKGTQVPLAVSKQLVADYDKKFPHFKEKAQEVYKLIDNFSKEQVQSGILSEGKYKDYRGENGIYGEYVPIIPEETDTSRYFDDDGNVRAYSTFKRSKGGAGDVNQTLSVKDAIAKQIKASKSAIAFNEMAKQIVLAHDKYTDAMDMDTRNNPTNLTDSLYVTEDGDYILSAYFDGEKVSAKISEDLYKELTRENENRIKQLEQDFAPITKPIQKLSKWRREILTSKNPTFLFRNVAKDIQDAGINSKHTVDMMEYYTGTKKGHKAAMLELREAKTPEAQRFLSKMGGDVTWGDYSENSKGSKLFRRILQANELMELAPRYAEYLATLEHGGSEAEAIYNAREVTTNFGRGGYITKALNRNGFTFLNANVQGLDKVIRNLSGENGVKGVTSVIAKGAAFAVLPSILNHLLYGSGDDKDEEYDALPDYIKDNYYLVKLMNGKFLRIPKGRINAVFGSLARRTIEAMEGEENAYESWGSNAWSQIGVGDSSGLQTVFTPITQAINNEAWYGGDIVPTRLQNKPAAEQTDASIDALSNFIGKTLNISPYKVNYVIDQYSGGLGDVLLPMMTEETTSGAETPIDYLTAPIKDAFIVNSIDDNKYASEFYNMKDKLQIKSNSQYATDEDKIRYKYMSNMSSRMSDLYAERREVQADTTLSNKEKYAKVQAIQKEINALAKEAMNSYNNFTSTDSYVNVGDVEYYKNDKGEWTKVNDSDSEFTAGMTDSEKTSYYNVKNKIGDIVSTYNNNIKDINDDNLKAQYQSQKRNDITQAIVHSGLDNYSKAMVYSKYYSSADTMKNVANAGYNVDTYITALQDIEELRTKYSQKNGYSTEQRKQKTIAYINSLDMNIPQKAMLIRNYYSSFRSYNTNIVEYVNSLNIPYEDKKAILEGTGMTVNGNKISWK